jgi:two-component system response regulator AtoC
MQIEGNGQTIIIAEDDPVVRAYLEITLRSQGYTVASAQDGAEFLSCFRKSSSDFSAVLLDIGMPGKDGMQVLREIRATDSQVPVIMVSGQCSPLDVVQAMRAGATDFIGKPVHPDDLNRVVTRALQSAEAAPPRQEQSVAGSGKEGFRSRNPRVQELQNLVGKIAWSEAPVLIQGETGAGKEVLARLLHGQSPRSQSPLLKLNCAALPSELVESELFGYERGAFTGAFERRLGMFEQANKGTILLDEIGDMDHKLQAKLLQVLQDHEFQRLGGKATIRVDVRVMAATHRDLEKAIDEGTFREDLYYRLNVISLRLPPLRERREDILPLAEQLLAKHTVAGMAMPVLTPSLRETLMEYDWPGNIRELENVMRRLTVLRSPEQVGRELRAKAPRTISVSQPNQPSTPQPLPQVAPSTPILEQVTEAKHRAETEAIRAALEATHWNRKQAATLLKIDYKALLYKMKKLGIEDRAVLLPPVLPETLEAPCCAGVVNPS